MVRLLYRDCRERRDRLVDYNPRQFVFEEDCFLRRKRCWIVQRRNRHIDRVGIFAVFEKQMRAATRGKRTNPIRVGNLARFAFCEHQIRTWHRSPGHIRRACAFLAIDAMTIDHRQRPILQHVSCPAANASTSELHKISLAHSNYEFTRMITNLASACVSRASCGFPPQRTSRNRPNRTLATGRIRSIGGPGNQETGSDAVVPASLAAALMK